MLSVILLIVIFVSAFMAMPRELSLRRQTWGWNSLYS